MTAGPLSRASRFLGLALFALLTIGRSASADDRREDAAGCYASARTAYENTDYRGAAVLFACAYQYAGKPELKYNEGLAWELANENVRAADAFFLFLAKSTLDIPDKREDARVRLERLESPLYTLTLTSRTPGARTSVGTATETTLPATIHLLAGNYQITVRAQGYLPREEEVVAIAGGRATLDFDLAPEPRPPIPSETQPPRSISPTSADPWMTVGWTGLAFAAAAGITSIVLGVEVDRTLSKFEASGYRDRDQHDNAVILRTATNVAWIAAAGIGAASVTLLVVRAKRNKTGAPAARVGVMGAGASVSLSF